MKATLSNPAGSSSHIPRSLHIIPPPQSSPDVIRTMEGIIRSLVLDTLHPIALEVAGGANKSRFIVRATTQAALDHVEVLLRAEYPELEIQPLPEEEDPFHLDPHEAVSAVELLTEEEERSSDSSLYLSNEERDPLVKLLAVLSKLPDQMRAIVQIALTPVSSPLNTGIAGSKLLNHIKDKVTITSKLNIKDSINENRSLGKVWRSGNMRRLGRSIGELLPSSRSGTSIAAMLYLVMTCFVCSLASSWLPIWLWDDIGQFILWGQFPRLAGEQIIQLIWYGIAFLLVEGLLLYATSKVMHRYFIHEPQEMQNVDVNSVYRTRIRFYVIGPKAPDELTALSLLSFFHGIQSTGEKERKEVILRVIASYRQFHAINGIAFVSKWIPSVTAQLLLSREIGKPNHGWPQELLQSDHFISYSALATLWHFPQRNKTITLKKIEEPKSHPLSLLLAAIDHQITAAGPVGYSQYDNNQLPFRLPMSFLNYHTLIAGESTEGKSAFLRHLAHSAMLQGGLVLIDPDDNLSEDILKIVPLNRIEDVVLVDLSDSIASIGFNLLDVTLGYGHDQTITNLLRMLVHIWVASWGTKIENIFEMSIRTLFEANKTLVACNPQDGPKQQYTLLDIVPLLTNTKFCQMVLQFVQNDSIHLWWSERYKPLSLAQRREIISPLIAKVARLESTNARRIVGQRASTLNLAQMVAGRKIILLKLTKSLVGDDITALVGSTILGFLLLTLEEQNLKVTSQHEQIRLPIIIDEFAMFLGTDNSTLAELHNHGATFFLSCQSLEYIQNLNPFLLSTVQANIKQLVAFHMSEQDAGMLHQELGIEQDDLTNLDPSSCYVAMQMADQRLPTFSLRVVSSPQADATLAESIRTQCRIRYAYPVDEVEAMLRTTTVRTPHQERDTQKLEVPSPRRESKPYVGRSSVTREKRQGNSLKENRDQTKATEKLKLLDLGTAHPDEKDQEKQR